MKREDKTMDLKGRHFLTLKDFTPEEIIYLLDLAAELKEKKKKGILVDHHRGKNVALIFEKDSTRTRSSFEIAAHDLGMGTTYIGTMGSQFGKKESIKDTARVLGRMYEGIEYRGFGQEIVEELAQYAGVPVWNGLTNEYHPTQMLADMLTIREHFGKLKGLKLVYMGDARYNMGNSLMIACAKLGLDFVACTTEDYFPNEELVEECRVYAKESGSEITLTSDVKEGTKGADAMVIGEAPLMKDLQDVTDVDLTMVNVLSMAAIFLIIMIVFKSISLPVILVSVIEFAIAVNMAFPYYMGTELPFVASIVIGTIQLGATVDYAILMTSRYQKERGRGRSKKEAIAIAHKTSMPSIISSGLSFFAATFGVACYSKVDMIGSICTLLARGAIISMIVVILVLPAMFMIFDKIICKTSIGFLGEKAKKTAQ